MRAKKIIISVVALALFSVGLTTAYESNDEKEKFEEKFEKTVALAMDGKVILKNISGNVDVKTWNRSEVKIEAVKVSRASSMSKARENAELVKIEITEEHNVVRIATVYPKKTDRLFRKGINVSIDYRLTIPEKAEAEMKTISGDLSMIAIGAAVRAETVSGDIVLEKIDGSVRVSAVSGDLELDGINGDAELETVSGEIDVNHIKGSVEAEAVSGGITISDISGAEKIVAKTISGGVDYEGSILPRGSYRFSVHSGGIRLDIPADSAFDLEAKTFSGEIESDFDIRVSGKLSKREIRGSVNGGGAELSLKSFSGGIRLRKK